ncbi:LMBR1-like motif protein (macronuclear) [Tetrahymena thermophila SB210]|uniref:LMBR1-like motif protein n=1 Tax=Tetrahymena thermophila (strain SB210) TaxID=312017 RepID=Q23J57_TETTS|nr:LMBR1-like motif protein [Tetrahymena thermophila SB210]EAR96647.2 LMBR1-like motif protein [Tetrahymena thermophila SB210]|eukprot:XP_001016892.2 LMBR1-like motif protein [Tetrahymena thermophila SB210]
MADYIVFIFPYQFIGTASYTPVILTKLNPTSTIQISQDISQFSLAQSKYFNPYYYIQYWFCVDSKGNVCVDKSNQTLKLTQNGSNIVEISQYSLLLNTQYTIYYQLMSQNFPFSKQYAAYQIDTGQSYPFALVQGIIPSATKTVQVNLQDVVYISIQLHTDFPYRIIFAQFQITLSYNNVQHSIAQVSNQFSIILEDYFPSPDFTQTVSVSLKYQIYDQILQQSIPTPSGNQPQVIYVRAPHSPVQLQINQQPYVSFQDKVNVIFNPTDNKQLYQFFYYNNQTEYQSEIQFPLQPKKKMLSTLSAIQSMSCLLPAGNIIVIGVLFDPSTYQYTNTIIGAIEQYEATNISPQLINQIKTQMLNRLMQSQWNQQSFLDVANTYMLLVKLNENLQIISDSEIVQYTNLIMNGFLYLIQTNQSPIDFPTPQASLLIENNDLLMFYNNYYTQIAQTLDPFSSSNYNMYVTISTWQNTTYLYRNELSQLNTQYLSKVNSTVQELLKRTYPIKIPRVYTNDKPNATSNSLRLLQSQSVNVTSNFTLDFGTISPEEKLQCIQRSSSGHWVHSSCQTHIEVINNKKNIKCVCQTPDVTSVIADITQLIDNQNVQLIFSDNGKDRISKLNNWYEYISIWTMIGLNVAYLLLLCISYKLDKLDKSKINQILNIINSVATTDEEQAISQKLSIKKKVSLFLQIKMKKASEYINRNEEQSEKINSETKQQQQETQQILTDRNVFDKMYSQENEDSNSHQNTQRDQNDYQGSQIKLNTKRSSIFNKKKSVFSNILLNTKNTPDLQEFQQENTEEQELKSQRKNKKETNQNLIENQEKQSQAISDNKIVAFQDLFNEKKVTKNKEEEIGSNQEFDKIQKIINNEIAHRKGTYQTDQLNEFSNNQNNQINTGFMIDEIPFEFPQSPLNKERHLFDIEVNSNSQNKSIKIEDALDKIDEKNNQNQNQQANQKQKQNDLKKQQKEAKRQQKEQEKMRKKQEIKENKEKMQMKKQMEEEKKQNLKKEQKQKELEKENLSRLKLIEYLYNEKHFICILAFHHLFQIFIIYSEKQSRFLRFLIYYNKVVWILTLNALFGKNLSVVQILFLSLITTIILQILSALISMLLKYQKMMKFGLFISFLFCSFCYYSILVVISGEDPEDSNKWIISYFITFALIELFFGIGLSTLMYFACKKAILKLQTNTFLKLMGAKPLLLALSS